MVCLKYVYALIVSSLACPRLGGLQIQRERSSDGYFAGLQIRRERISINYNGIAYYIWFNSLRGGFGLLTNYFDDEKNARDYIEMAKGYDSRELIAVLRGYLPEGSSVLELGMGPGVDLDILSQTYQVTGSDNAQTFLDIYQEKNPDAELLLLDAITLETNRQFDCIYSNKVLHHLSPEGLMDSFLRQTVILNPGGILFHSFWYGDHEEFMHGLRFQYYTEDLLLAMVESLYEVL